MTLPAPGFPFEEVTDFGMMVSGSSAGPILRGRRRPNVVRTFRFPARLLNATEAAAVKTDFEAALGRAAAFAYTPTALGEGATTVRFGNDVQDVAYRGGPAGHETEVVLEEDLKPA
ncbi:MAG: hypothetical protein JXQ29_18635 [Planctomycetes bacterium]|nr:hypothetical protein [Planctomycetota bacterium]